MKLFKSKPKDPSRRSTTASQPMKVSNYYTPSTRTTNRPAIDSSKRGSTRKTVRLPKNIGGLKNFAIILLVGFFGYNLLILRNDPIIVMDRESTTGRLAVYEPAITTILGNSVLNSNKVTLRAASIEEQILQDFPEIDHAVVSATFVGKRPVVHLSQQDLPFSVEAKGRTYAITANGVVAGETSTFTGIEKTILIRDESGVEVQKGTRVLRSDDADFFTMTAEILKQKSRVVERVRLTIVPREAYIKIKDLPYELRVYLDDPADVQMGTFFSAEKALGERGETPTTYMDLRAGEKVYWQ